jgi:hypothetical protein
MLKVGQDVRVGEHFIRGKIIAISTWGKALNIPDDGRVCYCIKNTLGQLGLHWMDSECVEPIRGGKKNDDEYQKRKEKCLYEELKHIYPELVPFDERTPEEKKRDAEQDKIDLFGPEEN